VHARFTYLQGLHSDDARFAKYDRDHLPATWSGIKDQRHFVGLTINDFPIRQSKKRRAGITPTLDLNNDIENDIGDDFFTEGSPNSMVDIDDDSDDGEVVDDGLSDPEVALSEHGDDR
jgi:hypothetical protein